MNSSESCRRDLSVASRASGTGQVLVAIRDSGPGLDPKTLEPIFDPFFTTKPDGMGLGLAISRKIIEAHGGTLWATRNDDRGATIALPADGGVEHQDILHA